MAMRDLKSTPHFLLKQIRARQYMNAESLGPLSLSVTIAEFGL